MAKIKAVQIEITKRDLEITESGLDGGRITSNRTRIVSNKQPLPNILAFLQRETELTRATLSRFKKLPGRLKILPSTRKRSWRNSQADQPPWIDYRRHQVRAHSANSQKCASLNSGVEEYLTRLYKYKARDNRTPYGSIAYDVVQKKRLPSCSMAMKEWNSSASCHGGSRLPLLGWLIRLGRNGGGFSKLYLVRETKSTLDRDKRREVRIKGWLQESSLSKQSEWTSKDTATI